LYKAWALLAYTEGLGQFCVQWQFVQRGQCLWTQEQLELKVAFQFVALAYLPETWGLLSQASSNLMPLWHLLHISSTCVAHGAPSGKLWLYALGIGATGASGSQGIQGTAGVHPMALGSAVQGWLTFCIRLDGNSLQVAMPVDCKRRSSAICFAGVTGPTGTQGSQGSSGSCIATRGKLLPMPPGRALTK
jgi:hypothetical protein